MLLYVHKNQVHSVWAVCVSTYYFSVACCGRMRQGRAVDWVGCFLWFNCPMNTQCTRLEIIIAIKSGTTGMRARVAHDGHHRRSFMLFQRQKYWFFKCEQTDFAFIWADDKRLLCTFLSPLKCNWLYYTSLPTHKTCTLWATVVVDV